MCVRAKYAHSEKMRVFTREKKLLVSLQKYISIIDTVLIQGWLYAAVCSTPQSKESKKVKVNLLFFVEKSA